MMNLHLSLYQGPLCWVYWQRGEEVWSGIACRVLGLVVHLYFMGAQLSHSGWTYICLWNQVRDHNLQSALISIWLSEGNSSDSQVPISTCTSSGCCWSAAQIQVKQESPFHKISGGGEQLPHWQISSASAMSKGQQCDVRAPHLERNPMCFFTHAGQQGEVESMALIQVAILIEHFRQPWWLASEWNECLCHHFYKRVQTIFELQCRVNTNSWKALTVACLWMYWERAEV